MATYCNTDDPINDLYRGRLGGLPGEPVNDDAKEGYRGWFSDKGAGLDEITDDET